MTRRGLVHKRGEYKEEWRNSSLIDVVGVHEGDLDVEGLAVAVDREGHGVAHLEALLDGVDLVGRRDAPAVDRGDDVAGLDALGGGVMSITGTSGAFM